MVDEQVDVIVIGDGVIGLSIAFAAASSSARPRVALIGRPGPGASRAAGAMLGVFGEITGGSFRTANSRARVELTMAATQRWEQWRERVGDLTGLGENGFGTGTFLLLNGASSRLDDENYAAIESFATECSEPVESVDPSDIPGYRPFEGDRASRALYLPNERFLDARRWLASLHTGLTALDNVSVHRHESPVPQQDPSGYAVQVGQHRIVSDQAVVAAGVWSPEVVRSLCPDVTLLPVVSGAGTGIRVRTPVPIRAVLRTPNRSFACGLHAVPQTDGTVYLGGTNNVSITPEHFPTLSNLHYLADSMVGQFHEQLATAAVVHNYFGNRPIGLDTYPLLGPTAAPGLWVATGTYREGMQTSPLIAEEITAGLLTGHCALPAQFAPDRGPITEWDTAEALKEAARHCHSITVETRMRPPVMGRWPQWLRHMYHETLSQAYATLPNGFVLHPELAPLAYERPHELATLITQHQNASTQAGLDDRFLGHGVSIDESMGRECQ
jgi:glycine oxidase